MKNAVPESEAKRIFRIIPDFPTSPSLARYRPFTPREKFRIAALDLFDRGTVALGVLFAAEARLMDSNPCFGRGVRGYAHYFGTSYADFGVKYPQGIRPDPERKFSRKRAATRHSLFQ